jgi:hypothetical protein
LNHWNRLWDGANNTIRSLTLEQLGFRPLVGHLITWLWLALFVAGGAVLCLVYLNASKPQQNLNQK